MGMEIFIENMNNECMYYTPTGDILYYSNDMYIRNKPITAKQYYSKYSIIVMGEKKEELALITSEKKPP